MRIVDDSLSLKTHPSPGYTLSVTDILFFLFSLPIHQPSLEETWPYAPVHDLTFPPVPTALLSYILYQRIASMPILSLVENIPSRDRDK